MTPAQRQLYARHLLLAEIGEAGQERLCAARVALAAEADPRVFVSACDYLLRAGLDVYGTRDGEACGLQRSLPDAAAVRVLAGRPELEEAAAMLAGAFAAVETIKAALEIGVARELPTDLTLGAEERR